VLNCTFIIMPVNKNPVINVVRVDEITVSDKSCEMIIMQIKVHI
jgi:hypothetical protein